MCKASAGRDSIFGTITIDDQQGMDEWNVREDDTPEKEDVKWE